jgi:hypothetical protein
MVKEAKKIPHQRIFNKAKKAVSKHKITSSK